MYPGCTKSSQAAPRRGAAAGVVIRRAATFANQPQGLSRVRLRLRSSAGQQLQCGPRDGGRVVQPGAPRPGTGFACCPRTRGSRRGAATGPGNDKTRERRLHRLVRLSRLLSGIACRSFAGVEPVAAARDFENRYGYRPWLVETFPMHRSARRTHVGATRGRGRQEGLAADPVKETSELEPGCRAAVNARPVVPAPVGEGLSRECRAETRARRRETWRSGWLTAPASKHRVLPSLWRRIWRQ